MSFNPAEAYLNTQKKFVHFLLDRTMGAVPSEGEESYWRLAREQLKTDWLAESETGAALYAAPVLEGLFPYPAGAEGIGKLERDGVLERGMRAFIRPDIVEGRYNLYKHQADSIRASGVEREGHYRFKRNGFGQDRMLSVFDDQQYAAGEHRL